MTSNRKNNGIAWRSLLFGGIAFFFLSQSNRWNPFIALLLSFIFAVLTIVLGIYAVVMASRKPEAYGGRAIGIVGLIVGALVIPIVASSLVRRATQLTRGGQWEPTPRRIANGGNIAALGKIEDFSSDLPVIVIDTGSHYIPHERDIKATARFLAPVQGRTKLGSPVEFEGTIGIHSRGSSTLRLPKHSFTFHLKDEKGDKSKVGLFGLPKDDAWVLYAPFQDKTLMRDALAYELSAKMGHYAPRTRFVEVFLNSNDKNLTMRDYAGVYVLVEKIKRGKSRVDIQSLSTNDLTEPAISGGYIFKRDHSDREEPSFSTRHGGPYFMVHPKADEIAPAQRAWLSTYLNRFESALYGSEFMDPKKGYAAYLDVGAFIDEHWLIEASKNIDGFRYSTFFYKDRGGKLVTGPAWDWNLSFGNANYYSGWQVNGWYWPYLRNTEICWYRRLIQDPEFEQRYIDRWSELRRDVLATPNVLARVDQFAAQLNEAQARNFERWPILGEHVQSNYYVGNSYRDEVRWMKDWIRRRLAWIDSQFITPPAVSLKGASPEDTLLLLSGTGDIYYSLDGTDPRTTGGLPSARAKLFKDPVKINRVAPDFARARRDNTWSSPAKLPAGGR